MELALHVVEHALVYVQGRAAAHVAVAVAARADVLDLVGLAAVDQAEPVLGVEDLVLGVEDLVLAVAARDAVAVVRDAREDVKDAPDALGAEDHALAHVHQAVKDRLVLHAMAVLAVLVRVLHVLRVADVVDALDVVIVQDVQRIVTDAVELVVVDAVIAVVDVQADVVDVQDAVLDAMAHVLAHVMGAVMDAVDNVKTHVQQLARQHALEHAKPKRLVPQYQGGAVEDPTVDLIANGEWTYEVNTNLVIAKSVSVTRKGTEYNFNIYDLAISYQKTNLGDTAITFINKKDSLLGPSEMSTNEPTIKLDSKNNWHLVPDYPKYRLKINNGTPLASFANAYYSELHFNIKV